MADPKKPPAKTGNVADDFLAARNYHAARKPSLLSDAPTIAQVDAAEGLREVMDEEAPDVGDISNALNARGAAKANPLAGR